MSTTDKRAGKRPGRGRPHAKAGVGRQRPGSPTLPRLIAVRVLERVQRVRAYADIALHNALARSELAGVDRALATELVYGTLRWRGRLDFMLGKVIDRDLEKLEPLVASTLRLGAYQLVFCDRIPDNAAVDQSVRCIRAVGAERATGLVNAALRRLAREKDEIALPSLEANPQAHLEHALSLPRWIAERWIAAYGASAAAELARACNESPPLTVRANRCRTSPELLLEELCERFPDARRCTLAPDGIRLGHAGDPGRDPAFLAGRFTVQDEASQLVVELLGPQPGERVLDACAAPGTKTTAIAERMGPRDSLLAIDRHARRLALVARAARRLGLDNIRTLNRDASRPLTDVLRQMNGFQFDRVLVDAPCSGLGALRRNADARWRIRPGDPAELATVQLAILERAASVLRTQGVLVYSTCTLLPEENEQLIERFLQRRNEFRLVSAAELPRRLQPVLDEEGFMRCLPHLHDTDGFFAARLERTR